MDELALWPLSLHGEADSSMGVWLHQSDAHEYCFIPSSPLYCTSAFCQAQYDKQRRCRIYIALLLANSCRRSHATPSDGKKACEGRLLYLTWSAIYVSARHTTSTLCIS